MSDFESSLQKWLLIMIVGIAITVSAMNYWYKVLPERLARERAVEATPVIVPSRKNSAAPAGPGVAAPETSSTGANPIVEQPKAREVDAGIPHLTLADGRTLGFATTRSPFDDNDLWDETKIIHPWLRVEETQEKTPLPGIPSQREAFTPVQLEDGRLALIGGRTPRDIVALESKCTGCPDEYIPFGEATPSTTTDVFDFETGAWSKGPTASHAGTAAIRLRDNRVLKVGIANLPDSSEVDVHIEIADSAFTHWEESGEAHVKEYFPDARIFESRNGAVILLSHGSRSGPAYHWTPRGKLKPWLEGEVWHEVEQLDEGHLQLTRHAGDTTHPKKQIVELP